MSRFEGTIIKGIGGFYYVEAAGEIYECKAKGKFRNDGMKPLTGDRVSISVNDKAENTIDVIHDRVSSMNRPPIANIDRIFIVSSVIEPKPVLFIIDKLTALAVDKNIEPVVVFTKCDLADPEEYAEIYRKVGIKTFCISSKTGDGIEDLKKEFEGHISALCGNSGVGKSSLLNVVEPSLNLKTSEISESLGRGKHTTRETTLFKLCGGYVADTPGFSSLISEETEYIIKENLPFAFKEFVPHLGKCKFSTCQHVNDKGCKIVEGVQNGTIPVTRHESYCMMLEHSKTKNDWDLK